MIKAKQTGMIASQFSFKVSSRFEINDRKLEQQGVECFQLHFSTHAKLARKRGRNRFKRLHLLTTECKGDICQDSQGS